MTPAPSLRLELDARTMARLLDSGALCAAEFRCLDPDTKRQVWRLLLGAGPLPPMPRFDLLVAGGRGR